MEKKTIGFTSAIIHGLETGVSYFAEKCFWTWHLRYDNAPFFTFNNPILYMGETESEANATRWRIKKIFDDNNIHDGDRIAVIYDNHGDIIAVGKGRSNIWIDVKNNYNIKTFKGLNLQFDDIVLACN